MTKRYVSIWFPFLLTDWMCIRHAELKDKPLVCAGINRGRLLIIAANQQAENKGVYPGIALADARALIHDLEIFDEKIGRKEKLIAALAQWAIRYTPMASTDTDGILLDVTGCTHLWGDESAYITHITNRLQTSGYTVKAAMADTIGTAWAMARFANKPAVILPNQQHIALLNLPPAALRLDLEIVAKLHKLGLYKIEQFIQMPRSVLRRRFGENTLLRIGQAIGDELEAFNPIEIIPEFEERLPCLEPIRTEKAIEIAIEKLLIQLCLKLKMEELGVRKAELKCYRVDGKMIATSIGTNKPSNDPVHLFKLFALTISAIAPGMGIELFTLEAKKTEIINRPQEKLWTTSFGLENNLVAELLDRLAGKVGQKAIRRFLPRADYWPERAYKTASNLTEMAETNWHNPNNRPIHLLNQPERIEVTAPIPDYPPMLFIYHGERHSIKKADGPERLERTWWLEKGEHRDYYIVEDEKGNRYWLFRSGHYAAKDSRWYLHGFFA